MYNSYFCITIYTSAKIIIYIQFCFHENFCQNNNLYSFPISTWGKDLSNHIRICFNSSIEAVTIRLYFSVPCRLLVEVFLSRLCLPLLTFVFSGSLLTDTPLLLIHQMFRNFRVCQYLFFKCISFIKYPFQHILSTKFKYIVLNKCFFLLIRNH